MRAEHPGTEDEDVAGPPRVDALAVAGEPQQQRAGDQPGGDDEDLPDPDDLTRQLTADEGRQPHEPGRDRPVDARGVLPRRLHGRGDPVRPEVLRRRHPRVAPLDEDVPVGGVVRVVGGAVGHGEQDEAADERPGGPGDVEPGGDPQATQQRGRAERVARDLQRDDDPPTQRQVGQVRHPARRAERRGGDRGVGEADEEQAQERAGEQTEAKGVAPGSVRTGRQRVGCVSRHGSAARAGLARRRASDGRGAPDRRGRSRSPGG